MHLLLRGRLSRCVHLFVLLELCDPVSQVQDLWWRRSQAWLEGRHGLHGGYLLRGSALLLDRFERCCGSKAAIWSRQEAESRQGATCV